VIQCGEQPRFACETCATLGICREMRRQEFERDVTTELAVVCAIHVAHASRAERCDDFVWTEVATQHRIAVETRQSSRTFHGWCFEKLRRLCSVPKQRLELPPKTLVTGTRLHQEAFAVGGRARERRVIELGEASRPVGSHGLWVGPI
jgi:hypothetical protein